MLVTVNASSRYDVVIESGVINVCGEYIRRLFSPCKIAVITDENVEKLYFRAVKNSLENSGFQVFSRVLKPGEQSKDISVYAETASFLAANNFGGGDLVMSLGGGVVGDLAGFVAATYHRGIKYVQLPTTLLSAIDASVGGKTAINLPEGKNLLGAFHQPSLVLCDPSVFRSLGSLEWQEGLGELCKYSLLTGKKFKALRAEKSETLEKTVCDCVYYKACVVGEDEFDVGKRRVLNLGHTVAHAVEKASGFAVPHGIAVFYGLKKTVSACYKHGFMSEKDYFSCLEIFSDYAVETDFPIDNDAVKKYFLADKKANGKTIVLALLSAPGKPFLREFTLEEAERFLCD